MNKDTLKQYYKRRPDSVSGSLVAVHLAFVLAPVYLAVCSPLGWYTLTYLFWFGLTAHGLTNLLHETAHRLVFKNREANDVFGKWFIGPLLMAEFESYRQRHFQHHRRVGEDDDSKTSYLTTIEGSNLLSLFFSCLFLVKAFELAKKQVGSTDGERAQTKGLAKMLPILVFQGLFSGSLLMVSLLWNQGPSLHALLHAVAIYFGVYLYGLMFLVVFMATLRAIAEHQEAELGGEHVGHADLRNLKATPLSRLLFGAYGFAEHASHHMWPAIPAYHLEAATREAEIENPQLTPRYGYLEILSLLVSGKAKKIES